MIDNEQQTYPPVRSLRRALVVRDMRHLTHAAHALRRSQSAITRSIAGLEQFLDVQLFERTVTGMVETSEGAVLFRRVRAAVDQMAQAEAELMASASPGHAAPRTHNFLHFEVSNANVFAFLAVYEHLDLRRAAQSLDLAISTARKSIHELERQIGVVLFEREPRGTVRPSTFAITLAKYTKRALWEIRAGLDELKSLQGSVAGTVKIGVMSTARSYIVPRAVDRLRRAHRRVLVFVYWANYDDLKVALNCGDIDLIVGTLRSKEIESPGHDTMTLMRDRIEVVARARHPLADTGKVCLRDLLSFDWILPPPHFALRRWFANLLENHNLPEPKPFMETASLAILRGTLLESDCVALSTRLQCWHDTVEHGLLRSVPCIEISTAEGQWPFFLHLTTRKDAVLSPAANALCRLLIEVATELETQLASRTTVARKTPEAPPA